MSPSSTAASNQVLGTIPVGKRPRGIHASPDGKTVYVALSGTPIAAPPQLDAKGNPIFQKGKDDDDDDSVKSDKSADAIGVVDVAQRKLTRQDIRRAPTRRNFPSARTAPSSMSPTRT